MGSATDVCEPNLSQSIADQANLLPEKIAIEDNGLRISYQKLHVSAQLLAHTLQSKGVGYEDPVITLAKPGAAHIMCQLAVIYAGGTNVPLDRDLSNEDIQMRAKAIKARYLIVDENCDNRSIDIDIKIEVNSGWHDQSETIDAPNDIYASEFPIPLDRDHRSNILFTSGSTGVPKAVEILGRNIIALSQDTFCYGDAREGRFGHLGYVSFDSSLLDTWVPLLYGATIVVVNKHDTLSPETLSRSLKEKAVTYMFMSAALFNILAPIAPCSFSHMSLLMVGGESPTISALNAVLHAKPPKHLLNAYGPAECTAFQFYYECTLSNLPEDRPPIGKPINQVQAYVLDEAFHPLPPGTDGELFIGGATLARGYLFAKEKTLASFPIVKLPGHDEHGVRLYRTGDIVREDFSGNLTWIGRRDREVKFRGYRVNLDVIESELVRTEYVREAAALLTQLPGQQAKSIVGCIVLNDVSMSVTTILQELKKSLPEYMVPQLVAVDKLPQTVNGKIDRKKLSEALIQQTQRRYEAIEDPTSVQSNMTTTETALKRMWMHILSIASVDMIALDTDFFSLGANSLAVASLIAAIRQTYNVAIPAQIVYECPTIQGLGIFIDQGQASETSDSEALKKQLLADTDLAKDLKCPGKGVKPTDWLSRREGRVFLTGATGFVSAFFMTELLRNINVCSLKCLVRAKSSEGGRRRVISNLRKYNLDTSVSEDQLSKLDIIAGDLARPRLGMDEESFQNLANWSSVIFHFAAQVNYNQPYSTHRAANVLGTLHVLQLATAGRRPVPFHYTSSIVAFGPTGLLDKTEVYEDEPLGPLIDTTMPYEGGYGQSQWVADVMVTDLMRRGFPISLYRLGFVLCSSDGVGNPDDFVSRLISDCLKLGSYPCLPNQRKELIPVDYVATAMFRIASSNQNLGRAYHIVPEAGRSIDMNDLFGLAANLSRCDMHMLQYQEWLMELRRMIQTSRSESGSDSLLEPLMPVLQEKVRGEHTRWELYEGMARYRVDNTLAALAKFPSAPGDRDLPSISETSLKKYLAFTGAVAWNDE
ncbi:Aldehyde reductase lnaA [Cladobotryum mycophilum]|uniref:Aldehyde reductase lnaA n=1 Tax=Cladobotryum mycophilum TaxID=491253 RepID=A0ABR0SVS2_9HYPO